MKAEKKSRGKYKGKAGESRMKNLGNENEKPGIWRFPRGNSTWIGANPRGNENENPGK
jgi:hypothetical protein